MAIQRISFDRRHLDGVRRGVKTSTARLRDPAEVGRAVLVFGMSPEPDVELGAAVTSVETCVLSDVTDADARSGGSADRDAYFAVLRYHYPHIRWDDEIQIIRFVLDDLSLTDG